MEQTIKCTLCGHEINDTFETCPECGNTLSENQMPSTPSTLPKPKIGGLPKPKLSSIPPAPTGISGEPSGAMPLARPSKMPPAPPKPSTTPPPPPKPSRIPAPPKPDSTATQSDSLFAGADTEEDWIPTEDASQLISLDNLMGEAISMSEKDDFAHPDIKTATSSAPDDTELDANDEDLNVNGNGLDDEDNIALGDEEDIELGDDDDIELNDDDDIKLGDDDDIDVDHVFDNQIDAIQNDDQQASHPLVQPARGDSNLSGKVEGAAPNSEIEATASEVVDTAKPYIANPIPNVENSQAPVGTSPMENAKAILSRHFLSDAQLDFLDEKGFPPSAVRVLGKIKVAYVIAACLGIFILGFMLSMGGEESETTQVVQTNESEETSEAAKEEMAKTNKRKQSKDDTELPNTPATASKTSGDKQASEKAEPNDNGPKKAATASLPATAPSAKGPEAPLNATNTDAAKASNEATYLTADIPAAGKNCLTFTAVSHLPWFEKLKTSADTMGASTVCALFGHSPTEIAKGLNGNLIVGPSSLDTFKGIEFLEVFPVSDSRSRKPSMEFYFAANKLFEIRLKYRQTAGRRLSMKILKDLFGEPTTDKNHLDHTVSTYTDNDLIFEYQQESWYGTTLKTIVLASKQIRPVLANEQKKRENVEKIFASAEGYYTRWQFTEAMSGYQKALATLPTLGAAYTKQSLIHARKEKFSEVVNTAKKALEVTGEAKVKAEAYSLLAVNALFNKNQNQAIGYFKQAASADPANGMVKTYIKELETGQYSLERTAITAARLACLFDAPSASTKKGVLARGNFSDEDTFNKAVTQYQKNKAFKAKKKEYMKWECR